MGLIKSVKACALMTAGRYENTWCRNQIEAALRSLGIPFTVSGGVYYGQCMQKMLESAIEQGVEYAITVDGDSVFTPGQLQRLLGIAVQESRKIDAVAAMQVRRGAKTMLGTISGRLSAEWDGYPLKVDTAHFGLTIINLEKLADTPKPWFFCQPDVQGQWGDGRIDSDVWFWKQWAKAGNTIYIDPGTRIGHVEEMVVVHDENLQAKHVYPADWAKGNSDVDEVSFCEGVAAENTRLDG